jgi:hypothetical protein
MRDLRSLFWQHEQFFSYLAAVTITLERASNLELDVWLAVVAYNSEGSLMSHTYCDTGLWYNTVQKTSSKHPSVGFKPVMQGSSDLCAAALTTAPWHLRGLQNKENLEKLQPIKLLPYKVCS